MKLRGEQQHVGVKETCRKTYVRNGRRFTLWAQVRLNKLIVIHPCHVLSLQNWWRCRVRSIALYIHPPGPAASSATELTPVHERTSRRLRGLPVEFQPMTSRPTRMATRDASTVTSGTGTAPSYFVVHQPRTPKVFYGDSFEDGEDWLDQFERVANFNGWNEQHKLHNVYYALEESARTWFENHEATLTPWNEFCRRFLATYACTDRREKAESALQARNQRPNESVTMYVEDMARLFRRADPAMSEEKKLRHLMRGVKQDVFAGLVRNPPQSVSAFLAEATAIERALLQRARQYSRDITFMSSDAPSVEQGNGGLRELVRSIVREELKSRTESSSFKPPCPSRRLYAAKSGKLLERPRRMKHHKGSMVCRRSRTGSRNNRPRLPHMRQP
ncbi:uncharacterized protein LOC144170358 [Haemaphysalis longicornis]